MSSDAEQSENEKPDLDIDDLRDDLTACFASATRAGSFAYSTSHPVFPNPALKVKGIGTVGLPLSDRDVVALKRVCHAAPFGKGAETLVDENVRRTWEIDARDVKFANPHWDEYVQKTIVPKVTEELGVENGSTKFTRAEPYKLLLYEPGAHFRAHQDSEKVERMYATLVVCLPSEHRGGEVVLRHGGSTKTWGSAVGSGVEMSYGAWYADVTHEVTPVTFGHRLVLTYNLVDTGPSDALHSAAEAGSLESKFKRIFERWRKSYLNGEEGPIEYVSCILDHQYTESSLSLANLKGKDKSIVSQAAKVAGLHEFTICLATVEATREGAIDDWGDGGGYRGDEDFIDEIESGFKLQQVVDLDGNTVAKEIDVNEESIVPKDYFKDEDPDDRDVEYTGNEGATAKLWYQKAAMVIVPCELYVDLVLDPVRQGHVGLSGIAKTWLEAFEKNPQNKALANDLTHTCYTMLSCLEDEKNRGMTPASKPSSYLSWTPDEEKWQRKFSDDDIGYIAAIGAALKSPTFVDRAVNTTFYSMPTQSFDYLARYIPRNDFGQYKGILSQAICQAGSLSAIVLALDHCRWGFESCRQWPRDEELGGFLSEFDSWSREIVQQLLSRAPFTTAEDAWSLFGMTIRFKGNMFIDHVLPYVRRQVAATPFVMEFLAALEVERTKDSSLQYLIPNAADALDSVDRQCAEIIDSMLQHFHVADLGTIAHKSENPWESRNSDKAPDGTPHGQPRIRNRIQPVSAAHVFIKLLKSGKREQATNLAYKVVDRGISEAQSAKLLYGEVILPFLARLIKEIQKHSQTFDKQIMQELFIKALTAYRDDYAGEYPQPPQDWSLKGTGCSCADCEDATGFLQSQRKEWRFKAVQRRRQHIEILLDEKTVMKTTEHRGSPQTLVVTKNGNDLGGRINKWNARAREIRTVLDIFQQSDLKTILGDAYDAKGMACLKPNAQPSQRQPLQSLQQAPAASQPQHRFETSQPSKTIPAKRKSEDAAGEVIDLTS